MIANHIKTLIEARLYEMQDGDVWYLGNRYRVYCVRVGALHPIWKLYKGQTLVISTKDVPELASSVASLDTFYILGWKVGIWVKRMIKSIWR